MRPFLFASGIAVGLTFSALIAAAWTGPTGSPPSNNVSAPINVGSTNQVKNGNIGVNGISVFGNGLISGLGTGVGGYLNFDYTSGGTSGTGTNGYGIWDNQGTLEFKNYGGSWATLQSTIYNLVGSTSDQWANGSSGAIYYNGGSVGIGTSNPQATLDLGGGTIKMGYQIVQDSYANSLGNYAYCAAGKQVLGGSCQCSGEWVYFNSGISSNGYWCADAAPPPGGTACPDLIVTATCADIQ